MNCFRISKTIMSESFKINETTYLYKSTCSEEESFLITQAVDKWAIDYTYIWKCEAQSDNGIDHEDRDRKVRTILPEAFVIDKGVVIGCYCEGHLFIFDDISTHNFSVHEDEGYVGGWGDISTTYRYQLIKMK